MFRTRRAWTPAEDKFLEELICQGHSELFIARVLKRPVLAIPRRWQQILKDRREAANIKLPGKSIK
jgi:hypothetical protein